MARRRSAWLFLVFLAVGVLSPALAGAISCGDCCEGKSNACGVATTGFSLCCLHSVSTLPGLPPSSIAPTESDLLVLADEVGAPPPELRGILHVPKASLI